MRIFLQIIVSMVVVMVAVLIFIALCEDGLLLLLGEASHTESDASSEWDTLAMSTK